MKKLQLLICLSITQNLLEIAFDPRISSTDSWFNISGDVKNLCNFQTKKVMIFMFTAHIDIFFLMHT